MNVTYATSRWGEPTETFVRREAAAVANAGATVRALSIKRPGVAATPAIPVTWLGPLAVCVDAGKTIVARPCESFRVVARIVLDASSRTLVRRLVAAIVGLAWAQHGEVRDADLVHAHFGWVAATAAWAATRATGGRFSVVLHAFDLHSAHKADRFATVPLRAADAVYTISERDAAWLRERWNIEATVLRMGVDGEWLRSPVPTESRDPHLLVAVGSLVPKKGHDVLIESIARTREPWRALIVGEGPERASLEHAIEYAGLVHRVRLMGQCDEATVRELVRSAAVVALACVVAPDGDRDGIPVAFMEAMASATPVVTTRVGAIAELVEGCGVLVDPGDPAAFAEALDSLAACDRRADLGARGRARINEGFLAATGGRTIVDLAAAQIAEAA